MTEIAGSLWSVPPNQQLEAAQRLQAAGLRRLHWDMTDGHFTSPGGFTASRALELTQATGLAAEAHIMAEHPLHEIDSWTEFCDLIVIHAESHEWPKTVDRITARGCTPGLAIAPGTPANVVPADIAVLCMSITPGTAGSAFNGSVLSKVSALREQSPSQRIGLDGGIQHRHVEGAVQAGANWLVVGTDLFLGNATNWLDVLGAGA
jgi:ribulose-phosphate 3-epimerase